MKGGVATSVTLYLVADNGARMGRLKRRTARSVFIQGVGAVFFVALSISYFEKGNWSAGAVFLFIALIPISVFFLTLRTLQKLRAGSKAAP